MVPDSRSTKILVILFLFLVILINIGFINSPGTGDVPTFERWGGGVVEKGFFAGYCGARTDYPPFSFLVLGGFAFLLGTGHLSVKISIFTFWILYLALVLFLSRRVRLPLWAGVLLAANPALIVNAQSLGYLDIYFAPFLLLSFYLLHDTRFFFWSGVAFGMATLLKWQPLIILPFFPIMVWRLGQAKGSPWRPIFAWLAGLGFIWIAVALTFTLLADPRCVLRVARRTSAVGFIPVSGNALNFNWIVTYFLELIHPEAYRSLKGGAAMFIRADIPGLRFLNTGMVALAYIFFGGLLAQRGRFLSDLAMAALGGGLAYFILAYGVHENHSFLLVIITTFLVLLHSKETYAWLVLGMVSLFHLGNLLLFYGLTGEPEVSRVVMGLDISIPLAMLYIFFFFFLTRDVIRNIGRGPNQSWSESGAR